VGEEIVFIDYIFCWLIGRGIRGYTIAGMTGCGSRGAIREFIAGGCIKTRIATGGGSDDADYDEENRDGGRG
jgi:hypothetical protein